MGCVILKVYRSLGPTPRYLGNALGEIVAKQHSASIVSLKIDKLVSKVGPLFVRNNPKRPYLREKSLKVIITNLLWKLMNRGKMKEKGVRHLRERNQRIKIKERPRASLLRRIN